MLFNVIFYVKNPNISILFEFYMSWELSHKLTNNLKLDWLETKNHNHSLVPSLPSKNKK